MPNPTNRYGFARIVIKLALTDAVETGFESRNRFNRGVVVKDSRRQFQGILQFARSREGLDTAPDQFERQVVESFRWASGQWIRLEEQAL